MNLRDKYWLDESWKDEDTIYEVIMMFAHLDFYFMTYLILKHIQLKQSAQNL